MKKTKQKQEAKLLIYQSIFAVSGSRYELAGLGFRDGMRGSRRSAAPPLSGKSRHDQELWRIPQDLPGGAGKRGEPDPVIEEDAGWTVSEILF